MNSSFYLNIQCHVCEGNCKNCTCRPEARHHEGAEVLQ